MQRQRHRGQRGASAVEFALVMPILFLLVMGIVQYGWYFYVAENTSGAASNLTRRMAVGDCWGSGESETFAKAQAPQVTSAVSTPTTIPADVGDTFTVTVQADANIIRLLPVPGGGVVTRTVEARLEDKDAVAC